MWFNARYLKLLLYYGVMRQRLDAHHLALICQSRYFDGLYYLEQNPDVAGVGFDPAIHYKDFGAQERRNPSPLFDTAHYLHRHKDILTTGQNPLLHFIQQCSNPQFHPAPPARRKAPDGPAKSMYVPETKPMASRRRFVIYTAVIGGRDVLLPPKYRPQDCHFVAFSDVPIAVDGWKIKPLNYMHSDPTRSARFVKLHPHLFFPDDEYSLWVDANISVVGEVGAFLDRLNETHFMSAFAHPLRDCIYDEGLECVVRNKDDELTISEQLDRYRTCGVPRAIGLWETNCLARRHNDPACIELMNAWWQEIESGSRRDQLSLPVVASSQLVHIAPLDNPPISARTHPFLTFSEHKARRAAADPNASWEKITITCGSSRRPATIGVCVYGNLPAVKECLASIDKTCTHHDQILLVDDASEGETAHFLRRYAAARPNAFLIRNAENLGYTRSANFVLNAARHEWIVLLNSDANLPQRALDKLIAAGELHPRLAVLGPLSNAAGWQTIPKLAGINGEFLVNDLPENITPDVMDRLCEQACLPAVQFVPLVNGFCFVVRKQAAQRIGPLDEVNFPYGYGEEDDFCLRAKDAGYICGIATNTYVFHAKTGSFSMQRRAQLTVLGEVQLQAKHGKERVNAVVRTMREHPGLRLVRNSISGLLHRRQ